ncbi:MAG TPA: hypothetical protein PKV21_02135 [bacterium]|nr:hypothetical protein [bacterium]HOM26289.1 hypothetical protein [bacterium]
MKIFLYLKGEKVYYFKNNERGEIPFENLENFIKENKQNFFYLIFSKLNIYFRKVEFEFRDKKKISLVLNQEIEGKFPTSIDKLYFHFKFFYPEKDKTTIGIFAVEKEKIEYLKEIFKKNKTKYKFLIDSILIHQFFRNNLKEYDFIELYTEKDYLLINLIENSTISGVYSYFSNNIKESILEVLPSLFVTKKLPVYFIGDRKIYEEIKMDGLHFFSETNFFNILNELKKLEVVNFKDILIRKKILNFEYLSYFIILLVSTFLFFTPHFKITEKEKKLDEINKKMENIFKSLFPETEKIVNPLIQIKEKFIQDKSYSKIPVYEISVIKTLEEITLFFPENINGEVEEVSINDKNINLTGIVDNLKNLDNLKENIRNSKFFKNFEINSVSFTKENKIRFNLLLRTGTNG